MKLRSLTAGLALLVTGTAVGVGAHQFASADVSSGDRPVFVPIETCRLVDTRENPAFNVGPRTSPLGREDTLIADAQQPGTDCSGSISTDASALSLNVTVPNATEESFITIWPDGPRPDASSLNPQQGQLVFNAVTADLAADQTFRIFNNRGSVDVIVDVIGYYENHDHDDRYYIKSEVDDRYSTETEVEQLLAASAPKISYFPSNLIPFTNADNGADLVDAGRLATFTKERDDTVVRVVFDTQVLASANRCLFQLRVDGRSSNGATATEFSTNTSALVRIAAGTISPASFDVIFRGLSAGVHDVEVFINQDGAGNCYWNPGGWDVEGIVEEFVVR